MRISVSPTEKMERLPGETVLDVVFGLGALLILIPALPIILLVWLLSRLRARGEASPDLEREPRYNGE